MRLFRNLSIGIAIALLLTLCVPVHAQATVSGAPQSITLQMNISESVTISCTPTTINFVYVPGSGANNGTGTNSTPIVCTYSWSLAQGHTYFIVEAGFVSASSVLTASGASPIPAADFLGAVTNTGTAPGGNQSAAAPTTLNPVISGLTTGWYFLNMYNTALVNATPAGNDSSSFLISLAGLPPLAAANYSGTLTIVATTN